MMQDRQDTNGVQDTSGGGGAGALRAVMFDLGGVVLGSPLHAILDYERDLGIGAGTINRVIAANSPWGAWQRLERGELAVGEIFFRALDSELQAAGLLARAAVLMTRIAAVTEPREVMLGAIRRLRVAGYRVGALTNNWVYEDPAAGDLGRNRRLAEHFDQFVESQAVGLRKPDPRIYHLACQQLGVAPEHTAFLDDIGANLKAAKALGMTTLKVDEPSAALAALGELLGLELISG